MRGDVLSRDEIVSTVSKKLNLVQVDIKPVIDATIDAMYASIASGRSVKLRNFGVFHVKHRKGWIARDPRLPHGHPDELVEVPSHNRVVFKPCEALRKKVIRTALG